MVEDLLDLSRFERGVVELHRQPLDLVRLTNDVMTRQQPSADQKNISLLIAPPPAPILILADSARIHQVINTLVSNAIHYTMTGGCVQVSLCAEADGTAVIEVQDGGAGIAAEHIKDIFQPFYRVDEKPLSSTGLGLTIAREIMKLHGGEIVVDSTPGEGSRFSVRFPSRGVARLDVPH
jgi:signal transduction histidine kinase